MPQNTNGNEKQHIIIVQNWQVFLTIATLLVGFVFNYATQNAHADETAREVIELKQQVKSLQETSVNYQYATGERLARIETKLGEIKKQH